MAEMASAWVEKAGRRPGPGFQDGRQPSKLEKSESLRDCRRPDHMAFMNCLVNGLDNIPECLGPAKWWSL